MQVFKNFSGYQKIMGGISFFFSEHITRIHVLVLVQTSVHLAGAFDVERVPEAAGEL